MESEPWYRDHRVWLELFVLVNLAFLAPDIYLAHSTNDFHHPAEAIPFGFSCVAPVVLLMALVGWRWRCASRFWRIAGMATGMLAIVTGVAGLAWHLSSRFLIEQTMDSLVYTAPFAAPLAYTALGLLLLANRMVDPSSADWPGWVLLMALGGFAGNFVFCLADHAQNGFFHATEWIPVASSAFAVSFLLVPYLVRIRRGYLSACGAVLALQVAVGPLGFWYHCQANLGGPSASQFENFVFGTPALAPLLFPNLVCLAVLALWILARHIPD